MLKKSFLFKIITILTIQSFIFSGLALAVDFDRSDLRAPAAREERKVASAIISDLEVSPALTGPIIFNGLEGTKKGEGAVVMAANIRTPLSIKGIVQGAQETGSVVIFQQAMSELGYTWEEGYSPDNAYRYAAQINETCAECDFSDYAIKGDHITVKVDKAFLEDTAAHEKVAELFENILEKKDNAARTAMFLDALNNESFMKDANVANAMKAIEKGYDLVKAEVGAGMTVFALDASFMPRRLNVLISAFMAGYIPETCSVEAEDGEIGGTMNSTVADVLEFITGVRYKEELKEDSKTGAMYSELVRDRDGKPIIEHVGKGLINYGVYPDRIAINNGTAHGNNYDAQGNLIETKMNLRMTANIVEEIKSHEDPGVRRMRIVQHGITGTPLANLPALRSAGITSGHVATHWQNIVWETLVSEARSGNTRVKRLVDRMVDTLVEKYGSKYNVSDRKTANQKDLEQLIGKELKNVLGQYKPELMALPARVKAKIDAATRKDAVDHFKAFGSDGTALLVGLVKVAPDIKAELSTQKVDMFKEEENSQAIIINSQLIENDPSIAFAIDNITKQLGPEKPVKFVLALDDLTKASRLYAGVKKATQGMVDLEGKFDLLVSTKNSAQTVVDRVRSILNVKRIVAVGPQKWVKGYQKEAVADYADCIAVVCNVGGQNQVARGDLALKLGLNAFLAQTGILSAEEQEELNARLSKDGSFFTVKSEEVGNTTANRIKTYAEVVSSS